MNAVFQVLIFPGLLFAATAGLAASWYDRKVTARVQMRRGPPLLQPFYDVAKLMIKETCVPEGTPVWLFLAAPLLGLAGISLASAMLGQAIMHLESAWAGDLIVVLYLLALPTFSVILGAMASRNPLASLGGSREMKLMMAYELPFILAACVPILKAGSLRLDAILAAPPAVTAPSGILALLVAILAMQAKLARVPFDMAEAETELTGGALIEYSGPPLACYKLTQCMMLFIGPLLLMVLFTGGWPVTNGWGPALGGGLVYLLLLTLVVLIRNTAPRLRIDQAMKLLWGPVTLVAIVAILLTGGGW